MNAPQDPQNAKPSPRWTRWSGPGLALLLLLGAGTYALFARLAPAHGEAPSAEGTPSSAPGPRAASTPGATAPGPSAGRPAAAAAPASPMSAPGVPSASPSVSGTVVAEAGTEPVLTMTQRREAVRQAANTYRHGRFNAFFREEKFLEEFARGGPEQISALREELNDPATLAGLPANTDFMRGKPEAVLERMSMIDMLHAMAPQDSSAREAMVSLLMEPVDSSLSDVAKKGLVGEKYDLLFRLAQLDRQLAVDSYTGLENPKLKRLLREALLAGLAESGATPDEMQRLTRHL